MISEEQLKEIKAKVRASLDRGYEDSKEYKYKAEDWMTEAWV